MFVKPYLKHNRITVIDAGIATEDNLKMLKEKGVTSDWREIVRRMNTQKCVTTGVVNIKQEAISIRQCTEPTKEAKAIYGLLNYKYAPFTRKKSVVPTPEIFKNISP